MSPIGIPSRPDDWDEKELEDDQNWEDIISQHAIQIWKDHGNIFNMFRKVGYFASKKMLLGYIDIKFKNLDDEEEKSTFVEFLLQVLLKDESSEQVLTYAFDVGLWA